MKKKPVVKTGTWLLNLKELAEQLGVSRGVADRLVKENRLGISVGGRRIRVDSADVSKLRLQLDREERRRDFHDEVSIAEAQATGMVSSIDCGWSTWTYVIKASHGLAPFKIGRTRTVQRRLASLILSSPVDLELVALAGGEDYETVLHDRYADGRRRGEWFAPAVGEEIMAAFARRGRGECLRCVFEGSCHSDVPSDARSRPLSVTPTAPIDDGGDP